jgi:hypothetical protein
MAPTWLGISADLELYLPLFNRSMTWYPSCSKTSGMPESVGVRRCPGRPSTFDQTRAERIVWLVRHGVDMTKAAHDEGIARSTLYRWLDDPRPEFVAFRAAIDQAAAEIEAAVTANIVRASRTDWRAGLAWLRTMHPERWPEPPKRSSGKSSLRRGPRA